MADSKEYGIEEIVAKIKEGHEELYEALWVILEPFIRLKANDYAARQGMHDSIDDMMQEAFLVLPSAVIYFREDAGKCFAGVLAEFFLPRAFSTACYGGRSAANLKNPLNNACSLDQPLYENADGSVVTLADTIADKQPGQQTEYVISKGQDAVESDDYWRSVNTFLKECFGRYGTETGTAILGYMLDNDCSFKEAVLALYNDDISTCAKIRSKYTYHKKVTEYNFKRMWDALKEERRKLMLDELFIGSNGLRDTGYKFFAQSGMSSVEAAVIKRNDRKHHF